MLSELSNISKVVNGPVLYVTLVSLVLLVVLTALMIYYVVRYSRRRNPVAEDVHGHAVLEIAWTVIPLILAISMFWYGWEGYRLMRTAPEDAIVIEATGRMWSWSHEYESGIQSPELNVPVGKAVRLNLKSADVIHSYFIPAFKVKQDVVPGVPSFLWFEAKKVGTYSVFCTEYCGLNHSAMLTRVNVMSEEDYQAWYDEESSKVIKIADVEEGEVENLHILGETLATSKGCLACHSKDGSPLIGPTFKGLFGKTETVITDGNERTLVVDEEYLRKSILNSMADIVKGFQPLMPPQQGLVSDAEVDALIAYLKTIE